MTSGINSLTLWPCVIARSHSPFITLGVEASSRASTAQLEAGSGEVHGVSEQAVEVSVQPTEFPLLPDQSYHFSSFVSEMP